MNFILTFLSYFLIGLVAGTIFSVQIKEVMDHGVVPIVEETYASIKGQILKSKGLEPTKNVSSSADMPEKNKAIGETISDGLQVFQDEEGYYIVDQSGMVLAVSKNEIKFYEN